MDWFSTGCYRGFGCGPIYPQVLPGPACRRRSRRRPRARAEAEARRWLDVLDAHRLGGASPSLADYMGAVGVTNGALIGFDRTPWPGILR